MKYEKWLPVLGFEELYEVSNLGRVVSLPKRTWSGRRILNPSTDHGGYLYLNLHKDGRPFHRKVHLLVTEAFSGPRPVGTEARHLDGNKLNNRADNLRWGTRSENNFDRVRHGTHPSASRTECIHGHPLGGSNLYINPASGARQCRTCQRRAAADYRARRRANVD